MANVIKSVEEITPKSLSTALNIPESAIQRIETTSVSSHPGSSKWQIQVSYTPEVPENTPARLFLKAGKKFSGEETPHEARFYQAVRGIHDGLPVVPCYDVAIDGDWSHILLKDLSDSHRTSPPTQLPPLNADCERIIDGLADLHAYWWDHPQLATTFGGGPSAEKIQGWYAYDAEIYTRFADFLGDRLPEKRRAIIKHAMDKLPTLMIARYGQGKLTLTFEDVHAGNFLYPNSPEHKLYLIDWEQWGIKLAMNDLAYMMAIFWSPERRARLEVPYLKRYHERIQAQGVSEYSWGALWTDYRLCVINHLTAPAHNWEHGGWADVWWNHVERLFAAYEDLNCAALLE